MTWKKKKIKKIGIDARFYGPIGKGLGRYTQEIADNVIKIDQANKAESGRNKYVVFLRKDNFDEFEAEAGVPPATLQSGLNKKPAAGNRPAPTVKKVLADVKWYSLAEQILMPLLIWRERLDLMHFPHFNAPVFCPVKFVVTIHDLILTKFPTARATTLGPFLYKIKNLFYKINIWLAVKRAKQIIAVSVFTKNDIVRQFKVKPDKVSVIYEGVANLAKGRDSLFAAKLDDRKTLLGYNINNPFLLYVGNAYPHKNLEGLIDVFVGLNKQHPDLRLVLVGQEDYFYKRIKDYAKQFGLREENNADPAVIFPGYVQDAELEILFKKALAYVFPSFYEGFGLPPLEAMAKGCPVVSSDKSSMPEVLGGAAIYFNPDDKQDMRDKIEQVIQDENLRKDLIKKGYEQAKKYNWWECARKTLEVYNRILRK
ncbi:glycosyltransferase family 4 protein [Patescibacteria group bacterium]|nr:glycosyltransferase family 4 protein [Patescibacteria group bacterium]MBU4601077.1 glycosyltransferase family 4 protein [Patescibacteria group bacterium]MCG2698188.1 glycosyltransferase family 4 protein [Candidatus Parcubacteria bacterium]